MAKYGRHLSWTGVTAYLLATGLLISAPAHAQVNLPNGGVSENVVDLRVKTVGGLVTVDRQYEEGRWRINLRWLPAELGGEAAGSVSCRAYPELKIQGRTYLGDGQTWLLENRYSARVTDYFAGSECAANRLKTVRWQDRTSGNWMEYERRSTGDLQLKLVRYGDRNDVETRLTYDDEGRLQSVLDHYGKVVLEYRYNGEQLIEIRDNPALIPGDAAPARTVKYSYTQVGGSNPHAEIETVTDVLGYETRYGYSGAYLSSITDAEGRVRRYAYTADRVTKYTDADGEVTSYVYDYDRVKKEFYVRTTYPATAAGSRIVEQWYDTEGRVVRRDVNGQQEYKQGTKDTATRSTTRLDGAGRQTVTTEDEYGNTVKVVYPDGSVTSAKYSAVHGQVVEETDELGIKTSYDYDGQGNLTRKIEAVGLPEQRVTEYERDSYGQVTRMTRKGRTETNGTVTPDVSWQFVMDQSGNVTQTIDPEGKVRRYTYDRRGNNLTAIEPLGQTWQSSYDAADQRVSDTDPLGHVTRYAYDKLGNLITQTDPLGKVWRIVYDSQNRPTKRIDPLGNEYTTQYNAAGKPVLIVDASGKRMQFEYDAQDRLLKSTDGKGQVYQVDYGTAEATEALAKLIYPTFTRQFRFDARGRPLQSADLDGTEGRVTSYTHDAAGNQKSVTDANGKTRTYDYDSFADLAQAKDPLGNALRLLRDTRSNTIALTDPRGNTTRLGYDRRNLLTESTDPLGNTTRYRYDDNGRLTEIHQANGQKVVYVQDDADRLTEHREYNAAGALQKTTTYTYDAADNLVGWNDGSISASRNYDDAGRLLAETLDYGAFSLTHRYTWHANNQMASHTGPDGITVTYDYDGQGQLEKLDIPDEGSLSVTDWHWFAPKKVLLPGGTEQRLDYDGYVSLKQLKVVSPAQTVLFDLQNQYGKLAELKTTGRDGTFLDYTYDDAQRLTAVDGGFLSGKNESFQVDAASNRIKHSRAGSDTWQYDAANQLTSRGPVSYLYDAAGNQIQKIDTRLTEPARTTHYAYDAFNRLSEITDGAGQLIARYTYDPFDRRLAKTIGSGSTALSVGTTWYLPSAWGLLAEADSAGRLQAVYGWHPARDNGTGPVYARVPDGANGLRTVYYHNDQLGTPQRITDKAGNLVWAADYDSFGYASVRDAGSAGVSSNLRYPGQYFDAESGLHYNDRRVYDPETGRYLTRDPIGFEGGINLYAYVGHNPINFADPTGEFFPACMAMNYLRCMVVCNGISAATDYLTNCQNINWGGNLKDCAKDCLLSMLPIPDPCGKFGKMFSAAMGALGAFNSFPGDVPVHVRPKNAASDAAQQGQAELKPIGEIRIGDEVLAWAEWKDAGKTPGKDARQSYEKVVDIISSEHPQRLVHLTLDNGEQLTATAGHPFRTLEGWRDAILLKKGGQLLLKGSGDEVKTVAITDVRHEEKTVRVYNLEVENAHTFFVGEEGVVVHNARGKPPAPGRPTPANTGGKFVPGLGSGHYKFWPEFKCSGWKDARGRLWSPTGGKAAHGGEHWDVQLPGGGHTNIYPGGHERAGSGSF